MIQPEREKIWEKINLEALPKLEFGIMRLPQKNGETDLEQVGEMVDLYMDAGMNYFDTAYVYHAGKSKEAIREAIEKRYPHTSFWGYKTSCLVNELPGR